jgi:hypothetical protein
VTDVYAIAGLNFLLCAPCVFICLCRLNAMHSGVKWQVKAAYAVGVGAFFYSAASPWAGEWPGLDSIAMSAWALWELLSSRDAWRGDTVPPTASQHADLRTLDGSNP